MTGLYARVPNVTGWHQVTHVRVPGLSGWHPVTSASALWVSPPASTITLSVSSVAATSVTLAWTAATGTPTAYTVRAYNRTSGALVSTTPFGNVLTGSVTGLTTGTAYNFTVTATVGGTETPASNTVTATTTSTTAVPTVGTLTRGTVTATTVALSWTAPAASSSAPVTSQTVYVRRGATLDRTLTQAASDTSVVVGATTALTTGTTYTFTVTATNSVGESVESNSVAATPVATSTSTRLLGLYPGIVSNSPGPVSTALGGTTANPVRPDVVSMYVQTAQAGNLGGFIDNWAPVGVHTHVAVTTVDKYATVNGVRTRTEDNAQTYMMGLVNGTSTALNFWRGVLANIEAKSVQYPNFRPVVFPACEPDVHWTNGGIQSISAGKGPPNGNFGSIWANIPDAQFPTAAAKNTEGYRRIGAFHKAFFDLARTSSFPHVLTGMWLGGFQTTNVPTQGDMRVWFNAMATASFDFLGSDPYANGAVATGATPINSWRPRTTIWRAGGTYAGLYTGWGSPPLILTETGISHQNGVNTASDIATWIGGMREDMETLDIKRVVYFNSNGGPNGDQSFTDQGTAVVTAFRNELAE